MDLISRKDAKEQGLSRYFTGEPCKQGHIAERYVSSYLCVVCKKQSCGKWKEKNREEYLENERKRARQRYQEDPDKYRERAREYQEKNPEKRLEANRRYREENREKWREIKRAWREKNPEKVKQHHKDTRERHKDRYRRQKREYYQRNKEHYKELSRKWAAENRDKANAIKAKYKAAKIQRTPQWADLDKIEEFYAEARRLTEETGIDHHVDHIFPLRGDVVSGLHVETNLQILTAEQNHRKYNKHPEHLQQVE